MVGPAVGHRRDAFVELGGVLQPAPAPRFDRTVPEVGRPAPVSGSDTREVLASLGYDEAKIDQLVSAGVAG